MHTQEEDPETKGIKRPTKEVIDLAMSASSAKVAAAVAKTKDSAAVEDVDSKATAAADAVAKAASQANLVVIEGMFQKLRSEILQGTVHQADPLHSSRKDKVRKKKRKTENQKKLEASSSGDSSTSDDSSPRNRKRKYSKSHMKRVLAVKLLEQDYATKHHFMIKKLLSSKD